jgi:hypothetical protein
MTETTQPDPAAEWRARQIEDARRAVVAMSDERRADVEALIGEQPDLLGPELAEAFGLTPRPPKPLTVADIPAGQGAASLFLRRLERSGKLVAWYRANNVETIAFMREPEPHAGPAEHALWDHLAATLPTVTD